MKKINWKAIQFAVALTLFIIGWLFDADSFRHQFHDFEFLKPYLLLASYVIIGWKVIFTAFRNMFKGQFFDINFLITVTTFGAIALGIYSMYTGDHSHHCCDYHHNHDYLRHFCDYFKEAAKVMLFFFIGMHFQDLAVRKSQKAIAEANCAHTEEVRKPATEEFITKFSKLYTPIVVGAALLLAIIPPLLFGGLWEDWIYRSLVFLVISCPCALVISVPMSYAAGIGAARKNGILISCGCYLDRLARGNKAEIDEMIDAGDVVLTSNKSPAIERAVKISRKTKRIVWQNIVFILGVKVALLLLGAFGITGIWEAVMSDIGIATLATLNALRAARVSTKI